MIKVTSDVVLQEAEIKLVFVASAGPGGQNVNKVATAAQLRFDVLHSPSLPEDVRQRLITLLGKNLTTAGELVIKANRYRTQERNKHDAIKRLIHWIQLATLRPKKRKKTKPTQASIQKRLNKKKLHSVKKQHRRRTSE